MSSLTKFRWGVISFADSLDTVGIIASNVEDVQKVYGKRLLLKRVGSAEEAWIDALSWYDSKDPTSIPFDKRMYSKSSAEGSKVTTKMSDPFKGLRIGIPRVWLSILRKKRAFLTPFTLRNISHRSWIHPWSNPCAK